MSRRISTGPAVPRKGRPTPPSDRTGSGTKKNLCKLPRRYGAARAAGKTLRAFATAVFCIAAPIASAQADTLRITALGDSLTAGLGLPPGEGLVPRLQDWLTARGHDVEMINAGVSGDTTAGGLSRLDWTLADEPDAMIVALGGNDLLRGIDPALSRANLSAILDRLQTDAIPVLLVGLPAPGNYGPEFQAAFAAIFPDLAEAYDTLLMPDLLAPITEHMDGGTQASALMQRDMIHPDRAGVTLIVDALGPHVETLIERLRGVEGS